MTRPTQTPADRIREAAQRQADSLKGIRDAAAKLADERARGITQESVSIEQDSEVT